MKDDGKKNFEILFNHIIKSKIDSTNSIANLALIRVFELLEI